MTQYYASPSNINPKICFQFSEASSADVPQDGRSPCLVSPSSNPQQLHTMVASPHSLPNLLQTSPTPAKHHFEKTPHKSAQTAQDKRSRLSNVINNLRKKVPTDSPKIHDSHLPKDDDRTSAERDLANLEKYVMTVLNGVIKDAEPKDEIKVKVKIVESTGSKESTDSKDESENARAGSPEAWKPSRLEPAVPQPEVPKVPTTVVDTKSNQEKENSTAENLPNVPAEGSPINAPDDSDKRHDTLGTIIFDKLTEESSSAAVPKENDQELRMICRDLLSDLLNEIDVPTSPTQGSSDPGEIPEEPKESNTSIHCSLPLEKVASILQNCQTPEPQKISPKSQSPTIRHLCLYCDRKFLSISLRQRHTDRVHQLGAGRRSERNSRKAQNCQYCSDNCDDNLEILFKHMAVKHKEKYHACLQCSTRYSNRDALAAHLAEVHCNSKENEKKLPIFKEPATPVPRNLQREIEKIKEEKSATSKLSLCVKEVISNPGSPEFDSSFYSSVSCNIRENLLHHLDGKLQAAGSASEAKAQVATGQSYEPRPIDISLTAATPVDNSEPGGGEVYENSSEYAQKPGKTGRAHPRRVSVEKYNFPRKYDGREQWTCSIKDLSKFDISTQLTLRKKQQIVEAKVGSEGEGIKSTFLEMIGVQRIEGMSQTEENDIKKEEAADGLTQFTEEFGNFLRLQKGEIFKEEVEKVVENVETVYAELTGEWSRPRVYICGACSSRHVSIVLLLLLRVAN